MHLLRRPPASWRRVAAGVLAAVGALVVAAPPAAADPPRPTDFRSTVTGVDPDVDGLDARVVGGDAFLELQVDAGHEVVVHGYGDEPYLWFRPDGTVERNQRSEATYLNDDRRGAVDLPARADNDAEPEWDTVADDGTYAWHDHRIHWMGAGTPPGVEPGQVVQQWTVALEVDGTPSEVRGELVMAEDISPFPWVALAVAGVVLGAAAGRRRPLLAAGASVVVAAVGALVIGWAQYSVAPAGSGANPLLVAVPLLGLVAAVVGVALPGRAIGPTATLAGAAAVIGWGVLRASVLWKPVLPTELPFALDRGATALGLGLSLAAAGLVVWSGGIAGDVTDGTSPARDEAGDRQPGSATDAS